jgi:hypothetical protein
MHWRAPQQGLALPIGDTAAAPRATGVVKEHGTGETFYIFLGLPVDLSKGTSAVVLHAQDSVSLSGCLGFD